MVFHQPFLTELSERCDKQIDILLGKPMPINTAHYYFESLGNSTLGFDPYRQVQWLIDTENRLQEYLELAKSLCNALRINLEIDVGLHRGGISDLKSLSKSLQFIQDHKEWLTLSGFMGYDPHVVKLPSIIRSQKKSLRMANEFYRECKTLIQREFPDLWNETLTFNGAGSPTINLHRNDSPLNDISTGSALVKPTTFDVPTLNQYEPTCYIATPVLKKFNGTTIPGLEKMKRFLNFINSNNRQSFFIYGGFWKADYCYPIGTKPNSLFGSSTNQTMINIPVASNLEVDDFVFLRPHQSEFVFLQFGNILTIRDGKIKDEWSLLKNN